jgi:hypothetical protein
MSITGFRKGEIEARDFAELWSLFSDSVRNEVKEFIELIRLNGDEKKVEKYLMRSND